MRVTFQVKGWEVSAGFKFTLKFQRILLNKVNPQPGLKFIRKPFLTKLTSKLLLAFKYHQFLNFCKQTRIQKIIPEVTVSMSHRQHQEVAIKTPGSIKNLHAINCICIFPDFYSAPFSCTAGFPGATHGSPAMPAFPYTSARPTTSIVHI